MVTYTVTADVAPALVERYTQYMRGTHIPEVLASGAFTGAQFKQASLTRFRVSYFAKSQGELDRYLHELAAPLREDFTQHFPSGVVLTREHWTELQQWEIP
jgi:hypothetical protein